MSYTYSIGAPVRAVARRVTGKSLLSGWINGIGRWLQRRRQWQALRELDDRLLADVGISPEDAFLNAGRPLRGETPVLESDLRS